MNVLDVCGFCNGNERVSMGKEPCSKCDGSGLVDLETKDHPAVGRARTALALAHVTAKRFGLDPTSALVIDLARFIELQRNVP